jgi:ankyrin repeat domain-containing protein 50
VLACRGYPGYDDLLDELDFLGPVQVAAFHGFDQLIHSAAQVQHPNAQTPLYQRSALMLACIKGNHACAAKLLSLPGTDVNLRDACGETALFIASMNGDIETVKLLLAVSDIDVNIADDDGRTALHKACEGGHIDVVKFLLNVSDIDFDAQGCEELSEPLTGAVNPSLGRDMVSAPGILVNSVDDNGDTALMDASSEGHLEVVKLLLSFPGISIVHANKHGRTALALAFKNNRKEVANLILDFWIHRCTSEGS